ncbi:HU family DNA-binding protein [Marivita sp.]|uniref:HU family DNA-binding protein n=1 Tax=Marivita sp. TaxID=2003365 RepID=UPI0025B95B8A|nr:HU family DNA-binding protein [Marivita sp.]
MANGSRILRAGTPETLDNVHIPAMLRPLSPKINQSRQGINRMATTRKETTTPRKTTPTATTPTATTTAAKAAAQAPDPEVVVNETPRITGPELKKKELIDTVVARSGIKKRDAKPVVEAMLAVLGETIADGRELNLAPMGKLKITRMKKTTKAHIITTRLRRTEQHQSDAPDPLAQAAE